MPSDPNKIEIQHIQIKVNGADLKPEAMNALITADIDTSLGLPDMAVMKFADGGAGSSTEQLALINDSATFAPGGTVEISLPDNQDTLTVVFKGEITSIEAEFNEDLQAYLIVTAYDKSHRLTRATNVAVYKDVTDSDVVSKIAGEAGLSATVTDTTTKHPHIYQDNVTHREFIEMLARRNGYVMYMDGTTLHFKPNGSFTSTTIDLEWGITLRQFRPRLSLVGQVNEVKVNGWDIKQRKEITASKTSSTSHATAGITSSSGGSLAQNKFSAAVRIEARTTHPQDVSSAEKMAQAVLDAINAETLEADGMCEGNAKIRAGVKLKIKGLGARFNGEYVPSSVTHQYSPNGYNTIFRVEGLRAKTMSSLAGGQGQATEMISRGEKWAGVYTAIVTVNAKDGQEPMSSHGSVKVKFPWLDGAKEAYWARVAAVGAGATRGIEWLPEVNDEVLVAFEGGDFDHPFVLGGLWNGMDAMPETVDAAVKNGKVEVRTIKTRIGHTIRLTDESGKEKIEIIDGKAKFDLTMDSANEKITLHCTKDIEVKADGSGKIDVLAQSGPVNVKSVGGNITVDSGSGNVTMKGTNISIEATSAMTVKGATVAVQAQGTAELKGNGPVTVQSSAITAVKGSLVQIN